ncbi:LysM peptidoglycan-binding domain-containing protein [Leptospira sp. 201903071]|uniref:LysM peptidoglycan-binding domain-containing protein n=1 Tax=Leptospira ainazelensis TaxID=2810034 RepID=UPI001966BE0C|nr:LysM peptidoglycan-binding domain-containing protein [Leptospira ainazelensis]MBM9499367.1 LysM peptidoglycan-binding domain-containing protein [Leptospira ainazelensis]
MSQFYVLKNTDTLQRLSAKFYGKWELWRLILDQNQHIEDWKNLRSGIRIEIPEAITEDVFHTIQKGDTYESISLQYYGTEHFSGKIREDNENRQPYENIGSELFVGALVSSAEVKNANRRNSF